ncbi:hypothetical protein QBZ16_004665 [Prototheca wickerhamii]|uniref:ABC transporter domain-containing protein n=1 Tax=Prototheca wickerhamii TaxID=3111 RepID=A0AAD9IKU6_PROWI|nr:hypothetical protein QBZ16_004665 [Prototheca wickerhamii]
MHTFRCAPVARPAPFAGPVPRPPVRQRCVLARAEGSPFLEVRDLEANIASTGQPVLKGVSLRVKRGEVHAIMGKNGSGKSTLSKVRGSGFQTPVEIPGVANIDFLRMATNARRKALGQPELDPLEFYAFVMPRLSMLNMDPAFLNRSVNEGFSGGEKKRNEILQLACLEADCAILDEIDSGLDIDALRDVANAVNALKKERPDSAIIMVTHYKRLLDYIQPDHVHIMQSGRIVKTGDMGLVDQLEEEGYKLLSKTP